MMKLPLGYYAIQSDWENAPKDRFTYKGVTYEVEEGVNLFETFFDAYPHGTQTPSEVLEGLNYESFTAPVFLFSSGEHLVGRTHKNLVRPTASCYLLGENAGVEANCFGEDPAARPRCNPVRESESETLLRGGYDFGLFAFSAEAEEAELFVLDGVTLVKDFRFAEWRSRTRREFKMIFRHLIHRSPCGHNLYTVISYPDQPQKELLVEDIRVCDFSDCGYGGMVFNLRANRVTLDRICVDNTGQVFGFAGITRGGTQAAPNSDVSSITLKNSYIGHLKAENGVCFGRDSADGKALRLTVENCTFADASRKNEAPLNLHLDNEASFASISRCRFTDSRSNPVAVTLSGEGRDVRIGDCSFTGFEKDFDLLPLPVIVAPALIENQAKTWRTSTEDPHFVVGTGESDFSALDAYYGSTSARYADFHTHSACGGTSDGCFPLKDWAARMDEIGLDYAAMVDHRQMRGFFLPEWDESRFVYGTEPGGSITDADTAHCKTFHYNMLFSHRYGLAMLLANFPEYKFQGDELTGKFGYPSFTKERVYELNRCIRSLGGALVHAHPKLLMASDEPTDYYLGEFSYLEIILSGYATHGTLRSYELWKQLLAAGKHVYASSGSDTHSNPSNSAPATVYTEDHRASQCFEKFRKGDFAPGAFGIKMMIDGAPMGSRIPYREGMTLALRVGDPFPKLSLENTALSLRVITDGGVAYEAPFDGTEEQSLSLKVQKRRFYRVEIYNVTRGYPLGMSNPIWLDGEEEEKA